MTVHEQFYVVTSFINGEYRETQHFGESREEAVAVAARSSRAPMIAEVHSTLENNPIETWVAGSYFRSAAKAIAYAADIKRHADFTAWRVSFRARFDTLRSRVLQSLQSGETITEERGNGGRAEWRGDGSGAEGRTFIAECHTPEYVTNHLMNRHERFGWVLEFQNGERYQLAVRTNETEVSPC